MGDSKIQDALKKMDSDNSGTISTKEFRSALYMACMRNPDTSIDELLEAVLNRMMSQGSMNSQLAESGFPVLKKTRQVRTKSEKVISSIDVDGTGTLSIADFAYVVGAAAQKNPSASEEDILKLSLQSLARRRSMKTQLRANKLKQSMLKMDNLFRDLDKDKDGKLDLTEFTEGVKSFNLAWSDAEIADCLKKIDADGNGFIEKAEFQTAFYNACIKNPDLGLDEIVPAALTQMK